MKTFNKVLIKLASVVLVMTACSDFEDINKDPNAVTRENVKTAHLLNSSFMGAQQDPHIAERIFVLTWKRAARFDRGNGVSIGSDNDGWNTDYFSTNYAVGWLNKVNQAINLAEQNIAKDGALAYEKNILQMARIWRAYLITELADAFGPIPILNKYDGTVSPYESVESIYNFVLKELKEASAALDPTIDMSAIQGKFNQSDPFYDGDMNKWKRYANSLRLRYAMRLSVANPTKAKSEFEDAAKGILLISQKDIAQVAEKSGWDDLTGVMSRPWNAQLLSTTTNNIFLGLGGIDIQIPDSLQSAVKPCTTYMGMRLTQHLPTSTNDPSAGYFFDGLPDKIDPRATVLYSIPGYDDKVTHVPDFGLATEVSLLNPITKKVDNESVKLKTKWTWNTWVAGKWNTLGDLSSNLIGSVENYPALSKVYRESTNKRVWFGPWETYFLLAEAAEYGWNVPGTAKENYEKGIAASFEYHNVSRFLDQYLLSKAYNRVGTSVAFDHTSEAAPITVEYIDGYTKERKTTTYTYPKNSVYRNGEYNNDHLTKIITQKFIAQNPWLPLEAWSDHRRLGLPFFENQAVEVDYSPSSNEVPLTKATAKECRWEFYPKRLRYPSTMEVNSKESYKQAIQLLGGENNTRTLLWWSKKK